MTGGHVYGGSTIAALRGFYLFTDYCGSQLLTLVRGPQGHVRAVRVGETPGTVSSFGEDERGELYLVSDGEGIVHRR